MKHFGLSKKERIKRKKDFQKIYSSGTIIFSKDKKFKAIYFYEKNTTKPGVQITAAVHKKSGTAVWRNRVKRLIKEAYRLNKEIIISFSKEKKILLQIVFTPNKVNQKKNKTLRYDDVMPGIVDLLLKIKSAP